MAKALGQLPQDDKAISTDMLSTPTATPTQIQQRRVPRVSVEQMNQADWDTIKERFLSTRRDDRPGWVRALDMLDYPRAQIAALAFPGIEREKRAQGETGAFGIGTVHMSDALGRLGLKPGVIRGFLGLGLDLATDPLSYLGPAGWGLKAAKGAEAGIRAGQAVRIGLRGKRAIMGGIKAVERGGLAAVADPEVAGLFKVAAQSAPAGLDNAGLASHVSSKVLGSPTTGRIGRAFSRVGGDIGHEGGMLANFDLGLGGAGEDAAKAVVAKYGKASAPGIRIGNAGSTVAHIPFTEYGIHVPAFSGDGKAAAQALRVATATGHADPVRAAGPGVAAAKSIVDAIGNAPDAETAQALSKDLERLVHGTLDGQKAIDPATPSGVGDILSLQRLIDQGESEANLALARKGLVASNPIDRAAALEADPDLLSIYAGANLRYTDAVKGAAKRYAQANPAELETVKRLLGTDDDIMGFSGMAGISKAASRIPDGGVSADIAGRIDRGGKAVFGQPNGTLREMMRYFRNTMTTGSREAFNATERQLRSSILGAMDSVGLTARTADDYAKAANLTLAKMYAVRVADAAANGEPIKFFPTKFNPNPAAAPEPSDWTQLLLDAQKDGYFSKRPTGSLADALDGVARQNLAALDELGSAEYTDQILGATLADYVPNSPTIGAQQRIRVTRDQAIKTGSTPVGRARGMETESFQKPRSTAQYRFLGRDGLNHQFFEKDRWTTTISPQELEAVRAEDKQAAAFIEQKAAEITEWNERARGEKGFAEKFAPRSTTAMELNEMQRNGAFSLLTGGSDPIPGGFMDTNAATVMASRVMAHERAVARRTWLDYMAQHGVSMDPNLQGKFVNGNTLVLKDGSEVKVVRNPRTAEVHFEQMGERYRPLSFKKTPAKDNPIIQGIGDTNAKVYHEDVARLIEDATDLYEKDPDGLLRMVDAATGAWKTATLLHPAWTVGNVVGDGLNYLMGGVRMADVARNAPTIARIIANHSDPAKLAGLSIKIRGVDIPAAQFVNDLRSARLLGNNRMAETALQTIGRKMWVLPSHIAGGEGRKFAADFAPAALKSDFLERLSHEAAGHKILNGAKAGGFVARDRFVRRVIGPWFRANEGVSDYMRALAYASFLEQGHDIPGAIQRTVRAGFDYSDATRVERAVFKRLFPFYSWMRLNGAYQLKLLLERPIYAGSFPLLQNAAEEAINGDRQVPMHARPNWMRNQLALMVGSDPEEQFAVMLGGGMPVEQALVAISALTGGVDGAQDFLRYFTTSLNPVVRDPIEIGAGREFFTDRTIGSDGDLTVGDYLSNQFRPTKEIGKISETLTKQGVVPAAARAVLGGKVQAADAERLRVSKLREYRGEEEKLRRQIATADYRKDAKASVRARVSQLKLYEAMAKAGFAADTPKWAQKQLADLAPTP